jgi:uncharacterized membrane protein YheB (UPF0754 family)
MSRGAKFGHTVTEATRQKIREKLKGISTPSTKKWQKGQKWSKEFQEKRRQGLIGRKFTEQHKKKIGKANSISLKNYFKTHSSWNKGISTDTSHLKKWQFKKGNKGVNHQSWKGGRYKDSWGYISCYAPKHPFATKMGYVREHRLVVEKRIGRYLREDEAVHHINGIKDDNSDKNLQLMTDGEHKRLHQQLKKKE